jgi:hypothetical protein
MIQRSRPGSTSADNRRDSISSDSNRFCGRLKNAKLLAEIERGKPGRPKAVENNSVDSAPHFSAEQKETPYQQANTSLHSEGRLTEAPKITLRMVRLVSHPSSRPKSKRISPTTRPSAPARLAPRLLFPSAIAPHHSGQPGKSPPRPTSRKSACPPPSEFVELYRHGMASMLRLQTTLASRSLPRRRSALRRVQTSGNSSRRARRPIVRSGHQARPGHHCEAEGKLGL